MRARLLGPQRLKPTLATAIAELGAGGAESRVATVTAGWQEREPEDQELNEHLGGRSVNLQLYRRSEEMLRRDPELAAAHHARQDRLRSMQTLYRSRLNFAMQACAELLRWPGDGPVLVEERRATIEALRALDARHLARVREVDAEFEGRYRPQERDAVDRERRELAEILSGASALAIAGGHVAVLLNRLRWFDLVPLIAERPVVAWSAGAMAISDRVILFHDRPTHGSGHAEAFEVGLGLCRGVVPLPHARRRLRLDDPARVALTAWRFAPAVCVPMDEGASLEWGAEEWRVAPETRRLNGEGSLAPWDGR